MREDTCVCTLTVSVYIFNGAKGGVTCFSRILDGIRWVVEECGEGGEGVGGVLT